MSTEGTTQGDLLTMAICALQLAVFYSIYPSLSYITVILQFHRFWYTDDIDVAGVGKYAALQKWWDILSQLGPLHAY